MKKIHVIIIVLVSAFCILLCTFFICFSLSNKSAFVDNRKLFDEFKMKKQIEVEFRKIEQMRSNILDSMLLEVRVMERNNKQSDILVAKQREFIRKQDEFREANEALSRKYDEQIWRQLNQYIEDFGVEYKYQYIYGLMGDGALMYARKSDDITEELIKFVNNKYDGQ